MAKSLSMQAKESERPKGKGGVPVPPPIKPGEIRNKSGNNGSMKGRAKFQEAYDQYGHPWVLKTLQDPNVKITVKLELVKWLAEMGYGRPPQAVTDANGNNLNGLFGVGYMALGNFTGASPANNPTEEPDEKV